MIGTFRHRVTFQDPGPPSPDGDGGYTLTWADLDPAEWKVSLTPASAQDQERIAAGTVIDQASVLIVGWYHPGVTTQTRMLYDGRVYAIAGVRNVEERSIKMEAVAVEVVTP